MVATRRWQNPSLCATGGAVLVRWAKGFLSSPTIRRTIKSDDNAVTCWGMGWMEQQSATTGGCTAYSLLEESWTVVGMQWCRIKRMDQIKCFSSCCSVWVESISGEWWRLAEKGEDNLLLLELECRFFSSEIRKTRQNQVLRACQMCGCAGWFVISISACRWCFMCLWSSFY